MLKLTHAYSCTHTHTTDPFYHLPLHHPLQDMSHPPPSNQLEIMNFDKMTTRWEVGQEQGPEIYFLATCRLCVHCISIIYMGCPVVGLQGQLQDNLVSTAHTTLPTLHCTALHCTALHYTTHTVRHRHTGTHTESRKKSLAAAKQSHQPCEALGCLGNTQAQNVSAGKYTW